MLKIAFLIILAFGAFNAYQNKFSANQHRSAQTHNQLIMYSLTTCGYCKKKARELRAENIPFIEYFIDKDKKRMQELNNKLQQAGYKPKSYGTPIFDVHGTMLPNNPKMSLIKSYLTEELRTKCCSSSSNAHAY